MTLDPLPQDYVKHDDCGSQSSSYPAMRDALNKTGAVRPTPRRCCCAWLSCQDAGHTAVIHPCVVYTHHKPQGRPMYYSIHGPFGNGTDALANCWRTTRASYVWLVLHALHMRRTVLLLTVFTCASRPASPTRSSPSPLS